jgi:hypothetical protein
MKIPCFSRKHRISAIHILVAVMLGGASGLFSRAGDEFVRRAGECGARSS